MHNDKSHDTKNIFKGSIKAAGMWPHQMAVTIMRKAGGGPWGTGQRKGQVQWGVRDHVNTRRPSESPWFEYCLPGIMKDEGRESELYIEGCAETKWEEMNTENCYFKPHDLTSMERFGDIVYSQRSQAC